MFDNFDYRIDCGDFMLYELGRLIDEDRASFEDDEFRRVIDEGIHEHVERRLDIRAELAMLARSQGSAASRVWRALEDIEAPVREQPAIIHSYTAYLFRRLEECVDGNARREGAVTSLADRLFESLDDRVAAEAAIDEIGSIRSPVSARVLAHVVSDPMLDEDLENKAYGLLRAMWPLSRHYILYSLKPHTHEDIPFRWFQLLVDSGEPSAVDRILEEVVVHGGDSNFREDLLALVQLLRRSLDPDIDGKIMQVLNSGEIRPAAVEMLETFLRDTKTRRHEDTKETDPWTALDRLYTINKKYLSIAKMFDEGRKADARRKLDELLKEEPQYPFALMLKRLI